MPKRFYLKPAFSPPNKVRRTMRWSYVLLLLIGGLIVMVLGTVDITDTPQSVVSLKRQSLGSTEISTRLAPVRADEADEPIVISTVQDTTLIVPPDISASLAKNALGDSIVQAAIVDIKSVVEVRNKKIVMPTITLFNGCGVKGIGARAKVALERMGFEVVEVRNAQNFNYTMSEVLDRRESIEMGKMLADSLGIPKQLAAWDTTRSDRDADVSLIVGSDFKKLRWKI